MIGAFLFGEGLFGEVESSSVDTHWIPFAPPYRLVVVTPAGSTLAYLKSVIAADVTFTIDEASELNLRVGESEYGFEHCHLPNLIRLFDVHDRLIETFQIVKAQPEPGVIALTGQSLIAKLSMAQNIVAYSSEVGSTFREVLRDLLAFQNSAPKIQLGNIASVYGSIVLPVQTFEHMSIMAALNALRDAHGGTFWVDGNRRLHWQTQRGRRKGQQLWIGKGLISARPTVDYSKLVTRIHVSGNDPDNTPISLADIEEYEETDGWMVADSASTYGHDYSLIKDSLTFKSLGDLEEYATRYLELYSLPWITYALDARDLSHSPDFGYDMSQGIELGSTFEVIDSRILMPDGNPLRAQGTIVKVSFSLGSPWNVRVEFGQRTLSLDQFLSDLSYRTRELEREVLKKGGGVSDLTPSPIQFGAGSPGVDPQSARRDHVHPLDPSDWSDLMDAIMDQLGNGSGGGIYAGMRPIVWAPSAEAAETVKPNDGWHPIWMLRINDPEAVNYGFEYIRNHDNTDWVLWSETS